jgi:hypothetical protein
MIPLNPDSDKWLVTFCFWTLKYRDIGLFMPYILCGIYGLYEGPCPIWGSTALHICRTNQHHEASRGVCLTTLADGNPRVMLAIKFVECATQQGQKLYSVLWITRSSPYPGRESRGQTSHTKIALDNQVPR